MQTGREDSTKDKQEQWCLGNGNSVAKESLKQSTRYLCGWRQREQGQGVPQNHGRLLERCAAYSDYPEQETASREISVPAGAIRNSRRRAGKAHLPWWEEAGLGNLSTSHNRQALEVDLVRVQIWFHNLLM